MYLLCLMILKDLVRKKEINHWQLFCISFRNLYFRNRPSKDWNQWGSNTPWKLVTYFPFVLFPICFPHFHYLLLPPIFPWGFYCCISTPFSSLPSITSAQPFCSLSYSGMVGVICFTLTMVSNPFEDNARKIKHQFGSLQAFWDYKKIAGD